MPRLSVLGSGSKGNAVLVLTPRTTLLIDCGLPIRELTLRLGQTGRTIADLDGLLITHEHDDHVRSLQELAEGYGVPVYCHQRLLSLLKSRMRLSGAQPFDCNAPFAIRDVLVTPFHTSHDAVCPVGFAVDDEHASRLLYATDLGYVPAAVTELGRSADVVFLESNHDTDLLAGGRYPEFLKRRIRSMRGHLSNADCAAALANLMQNSTTSQKTFVLGHLSEENNIPELAFWETVHTLEGIGGKNGMDWQVHVAPQHGVLREVGKA